MPFTEAHSPTALPRRSPANSQVNRPSTAGPSAEAAAPPRQRHRISSSSDGAVAAPMAHTAVAIIEAQYIRRLPNRSPIQPTSGIVAVKVIRKPTTTNTPLPSGAPNSARMAGIGTFTTLLLTVPTKVPESSAASANGVPAPSGTAGPAGTRLSVSVMAGTSVADLCGVAARDAVAPAPPLSHSRRGEGAACAGQGAPRCRPESDIVHSRAGCVPRDKPHPSADFNVCETPRHQDDNVGTRCTGPSAHRCAQCALTRSGNGPSIPTSDCTAHEQL